MYLQALEGSTNVMSVHLYIHLILTPQQQCMFQQTKYSSKKYCCNYSHVTMAKRIYFPQQLRVTEQMNVRKEDTGAANIGLLDHQCDQRGTKVTHSLAAPPAGSKNHTV